MKTHAVRISDTLYEQVRARAATERRSLTQQANILLEHALHAIPVGETPPPWPGEDDIPGKPLIEVLDEEPEPEPEPKKWVTPTQSFVRADEVTPDWK
jgi:hypothetical protein